MDIAAHVVACLLFGLMAGACYGFWDRISSEWQ